MVKVLEDWDARCIGALGEIEAQIKEVRRRAGEVRRREKENEKAVEQAMGEEREVIPKTPGKRGAGDKDGDGDGDGGPGEVGDEMEVDEGPGRGRPRGAKRGGGRLAGLAKRMGG